MKRRLVALFAVSTAVMMSPARLGAQAFTAPQGLGSVTIAAQYVDNTGHRLSDGLLLSRGQSVSTSALVEVDYGVTDRWSVTGGIPFVFAKYTGALPPQSRLPLDSCRCWHSGFQDLSVAARYRFGDDTRAITPLVRYVRPSHDYPYVGEAVVGRNLQELHLGLNGGLRLGGLLRKADVQSSYTYALVEKPVRGLSINRSNASLTLGYALTSKIHVHGAANWQKTHGGLRFGSPTGNPFPPPGEFNTAERFAQRDRLLSTQYRQVGGGLSYSIGPVDLFASAMKYVWGRDAHNGQVYTLGSSWYFDVSR